MTASTEHCCGNCRYRDDEVCVWVDRCLGHDTPFWFLPEIQPVDNDDGNDCPCWALSSPPQDRAA